MCNYSGCQKMETAACSVSYDEGRLATLSYKGRGFFGSMVGESGGGGFTGGQEGASLEEI